MKKPLLLTAFTLVAAGALIAATPPGLQPAPERLPGCDPCEECGLESISTGFKVHLTGAQDNPCIETMFDLSLEVTGTNATATYELVDTHGLEALAPGDSVSLDFEDPGFEPVTAKLHYAFDDGSYGTSILDIE